MSMMMPKVPKPKPDPAIEAQKAAAAMEKESSQGDRRQRQLATMAGLRGSRSLTSNGFIGFINPISAALGAGRSMGA